MNWDEFVKKEVTLERILIGIGILLLIVVMIFYYMGFFENGDDFKQSNVEKTEVLEEHFGELFVEEQEEVEVEEVEKVVENIDEVIVDDMDYPSAAFIQCLADAGMVIYGSSTCPACSSLVEQFGGYEAISPIYVECRDNRQRCDTEKQENYVPEIQIDGVLFKGARNLQNFAVETGCEL